MYCNHKFRRNTCRNVDFLTHWGRVTHICVSKLTIIGSDTGLSPDRGQDILWTNAGILLIGPLGTSFSEISIEILTFSFKKMRSKVSSAKRRPFCLGLNVLSILSYQNIIRSKRVCGRGSYLLWNDLGCYSGFWHGLFFVETTLTH